MIDMTVDEMLNFWLDQTDILERITAGEIVGADEIERSSNNFWMDFSDEVGNFIHVNNSPSASKIHKKLAEMGLSACEMTHKKTFVFLAVPTDEWMMARPIPKKVIYDYIANFGDDCYAFCSHDGVELFVNGWSVGKWPETPISDIPEISKLAEIYALKRDIKKERAMTFNAETLAHNRQVVLDELRQHADKLISSLLKNDASLPI